MDSNDQPPKSELLRSTTIPISQLSSAREENSIHTVVSLVWPYSSSTKCLSLLLSELDFRLRRSNGQVKVTFHGVVAEKVAKTQVGIGDEMILSLAGSRLIDSEDATQTPGRRVAWDVHFDSRVFLEILRAGKPFATVDVESVVSTAQKKEHEHGPPATPRAVGTIDVRADLGSWESPAFLRSSRASLGGLVDSAFDPFAEEDGFVPGKGRKRPRFSMRSSEWRVVDEPESPCDKETPVDWLDEDEDNEQGLGGEVMRDETNPSDHRDKAEIQVTAPDAEDISTAVKPEDEMEKTASRKRSLPEVAEGSHGFPFVQPPRPEMQPPVADAIRTIRTSDRQAMFQHALHMATETPLLHPVPSPGLPVPSPLVTSSNNRNGYFAPVVPVDRTVSMVASTHTINITKDAISEPQSDDTPMQAAERAIDPGTVDTGTRIVESAPRTENIDVTFQPPAPTDMSEANKPTLTADIQPEEGAKILTEFTGQDRLPALISNPAAAAPEASMKDAEYPNEQIVEETKEERDLQQHYDESQYEDSLGEEDDERRKSEELDEKYTEEELKRESEVDELDEEEEEEDDAEQSRPHQNEQFIESISRHQIDVEEVKESAEATGEEPDIKVEEASKDVKTYHSIGFGPEESSDRHAEVEEDHKESLEQPMEEPESAIEDATDSLDVHSPVRRLDPEGGYDHYAEDEEDEDDEDEELYDEEELEYEYDSEHIYEDEYESEIVSEIESEDSRQYQGQRPPPPRTTQPEVIVLDSDSEDEAPVHLQQPVTSRQEIVGLEEPELSERSYEYQSMSDDVDSEGEEDLSAVEEEQARVVEEDQMMEEDIGGEEMKEEQIEEYQIKDEKIEEECIKTEQIEGGQVMEEELQEEQAKEECMDEERTGEERIKEEHVKEEHVKEEPIEQEQIEEEQVEDEPTKTVETHIRGPSITEPITTEAEASLSEPNQVLHESSGSPSYSDQQSPAEPEPASCNVESVIDPDLLRTQPSSEEVHLETGQSQEGHDKQAELKPIQSLGPSDPARAIDYDLSFDGASSPRPMQQSASMIQDQALITPNPSQEAAVKSQLVTSQAVDEMLPTPQNTQGASLDSTLHSQTELLPESKQLTRAPSIPAEEPVTSAKADTSRASSVSVTQEELEAKKEPAVDVNAHDQENLAEEESLHGEVDLHDKYDEAPESSEDEVEDPHRNAPGLCSELSSFAPLATLVDHVNALNDTISIVHEISPAIRALPDKGDYILTVQLTDPSMAGTMLPARIVRPSKEALPSLAEGDAILLHDFKVVEGFNHSMMLVSAETSAWAVFNGSVDEAQIAGPPLEYGTRECAYAAELRKWYQEHGAAMIADRTLQASIEMASMEVTPTTSAAPSEVGSYDATWPASRRDSGSSFGGTRRRKSTPRRITMHELRGGRKYPEAGSLSDKESIHRLRDGTVYANL